MGGRLTMHFALDSTALTMLRQLIDEVTPARVQKMNSFDRAAFEELKRSANEPMTEQERDAAREAAKQKHAERLKPKCGAVGSRPLSGGKVTEYVCERPEGHGGDCRQGYVMWPKGGGPYVMAAGEKMRF